MNYWLHVIRQPNPNQDTFVVGLGRSQGEYHSAMPTIHVPSWYSLHKRLSSCLHVYGAEIEKAGDQLMSKNVYTFHLEDLDDAQLELFGFTKSQIAH